AYLDLGIEKRYTIKHTSLYDGIYNGNFILEYGEPGHWQPLLARPLNKNGEWAEYPIDIEHETRYLRLTKNTYARMFEIRLYGIEIPPDHEAPAKITDLQAASIGSAVQLE